MLRAPGCSRGSERDKSSRCPRSPRMPPMPPSLKLQATGSHLLPSSPAAPHQSHQHLVQVPPACGQSGIPVLSSNTRPATFLPILSTCLLLSPHSFHTATAGSQNPNTKHAFKQHSAFPSHPERSPSPRHADVCLLLQLLPRLAHRRGVPASRSYAVSPFPNKPNSPPTPVPSALRAPIHNALQSHCAVSSFMSWFKCSLFMRFP